MPFAPRLSSIPLILAALAMAPACAKSKGPSMTPAAGPSAERLSDEQIWNAAEAINRGEAEEARVAAQHAQSHLVKGYAKHMIQAAADEARTERDVTSRLGISPHASRFADKLSNDERDDINKLHQTSPADFDRTYIAMEVRDHQRVLDTIDRELLPQARDPQLKAELRAMRDRVAEHLDEAKRVEGGLKAAAPKEK